MIPVVSIHCIVYNHERYLRDTLNGFVMQKTSFPFEAIVHDDVSSDGSKAIIEEYAKRYPEIIKPVYEVENQYSKHNGSLERVMENATNGKYVAVCEGDDYWTDPFKLQKQYEFMEANPEFIMCCHNAFSDFGNKRGIEISPTIKSHEITLEEMLHAWFIPTASLFYRFDKYKEIEHSKAYVNDDYALEIRLLSKGKVYYDDSIMATYRRHQEGINALLNKNKVDMYQKLIDLLADLSILYTSKDQLLFQEAIKGYECKKQEIIKDIKYPIRKYLDWRYYKRLVFKKLQITRT